MLQLHHFKIATLIIVMFFFLLKIFHLGLNMPTLRTTWEAKRQLVDLLVQSGIPEECMVPQCFNFTGPDPKLDMLVALIAMGTYPNVCMHKEKRKVLTTGKFIFHVISTGSSIWIGPILDSYCGFFL